MVPPLRRLLDDANFDDSVDFDGSIGALRDLGKLVCAANGMQAGTSMSGNEASAFS
jgi:hypothetical protein